MVGKREILVASIRLESGNFESTLRMPLPMTESERKSFIERWLEMMVAAFKLDVSQMAVNFNTPPASTEQGRE